jgi:hypothetical protein
VFAGAATQVSGHGANDPRMQSGEFGERALASAPSKRRIAAYEDLAMNEGARVPFTRFRTLAEAFDGPASDHFGIESGRTAAKDPRSRYSLNHDRDPGVGRFRFDVSNNAILCSLWADGLPANAHVLKRLVRKATPNTGNHSSAEKVSAGPWPFTVSRTDGPPMALHELPDVGLKVLGNLFPLYTYRQDHLQTRMLAFAPATTISSTGQPRAVVFAFQFENQSQRLMPLTLSASNRVEDVEKDERAGATEAVICLDGTSWQPRFPQITMALAPGQAGTVALAYLVGENLGELRQTAAQLRAHTALDWLNETWHCHAARLGRLSIPEAPYYPEALARHRELARGFILRPADGSLAYGQGALPTFYSALPLSMLEPQLCLDAMSYFLQWGVPDQAYGWRLDRFPNSLPETHSLSKSVAAYNLAGTYYQMTGDREFFLRHPEILESAKHTLGNVLKSRRSKLHLFPSFFISDGPARGDYHTGSNVAAWHAFQQMSRLARECYHDTKTAAEWAAIAEKVKADILRYCAGQGTFGRQFFEGANGDLTFITGRDGEESDTTLMPFYGLCDTDDPALINHARVALSPQNPYYSAALDGIWWWSNAGFQPRADWGKPGYFGATFPGWNAGLAGAASERELLARLEQIRGLTDLDGSIWWWPYNYGCTDPARVVREPGKCDWSAGLYVCQFINNILGLRVDVPARQVSLRPFCPWSEFTWTQTRLGAAMFDFSYRRIDRQITGEIGNRNTAAFEGTIELLLPEGASVAQCDINGRPAEDRRQVTRYGRPAVRINRQIEPNGVLRLDVTVVP